MFAKLPVGWHTTFQDAGTANSGNEATIIHFNGNLLYNSMICAMKILNMIVTITVALGCCSTAHTTFFLTKSTRLNEQIYDLDIQCNYYKCTDHTGI